MPQEHNGVMPCVTWFYVWQQIVLAVGRTMLLQAQIVSWSGIMSRQVALHNACE